MRIGDDVLHRLERAAEDDADALERGSTPANLRIVAREELRRAYMDGWSVGYSDGSMDQVAARLRLKEREEGQ